MSKKLSDRDMTLITDKLEEIASAENDVKRWKERLKIFANQNSRIIQEYGYIKHQLKLARKQTKRGNNELVYLVKENCK